MNGINKKRVVIALAAIGAYAVRFLFYYLTAFVFESTALSYIHFFYQDALDAIFPILALLLLLPSFCQYGFKGAFTSGLLYCSVPLISVFPSYFFEYAYAGYEIADVFLFSLLFSLLSYVTVYATVIILLILLLFVTKTIAKKKGRSNAKVKPALEKRIILFDFSEPVSLGLISVCTAVFVYKLALEIYDTAAYLSNYSGTYTPGEIIYLMTRYLFILSVFILSYLTAYKIKNILINKN